MLAAEVAPTRVIRVRVSAESARAAKVQPLLPRLAATDFPECKPMSCRLRTLLPVLFAALLAAPAVAQDEYVVALSQTDPSAILPSAGGVLMRAPDAATDDLFPATPPPATTPGEPQTS